MYLSGFQLSILLGVYLGLELLASAFKHVSQVSPLPCLKSSNDLPLSLWGLANYGSWAESGQAHVSVQPRELLLGAGTLVRGRVSDGASSSGPSSPFCFQCRHPWPAASAHPCPPFVAGHTGCHLQVGMSSVNDCWVLSGCISFRELVTQHVVSTLAS